jgi:hypothetical protein
VITQHFSTFIIEELLVATKCFLVYISKEHLAAFFMYIYEEHLAATRHFLAFITKKA